MKCLHTADWHLRDADIEEAGKCLDRVVERAGTEEVDLTVIAGDVFDSRDIRMDSNAARLAIKTISALADIAPVAVVLGTPSHDGSAPEILRYAKGKYDVFVASRPQQVYLEDGFFFARPAGGREPECVLTLMPQPTKQFFQTNSDIKTADQEIGAAMSQVFAGFGAMAAEYNTPHILVYHGGISGAKISNGQTLTGQDIEVSIEQLNLTGAHLHLCGHIHLPQQVWATTFYSGSLYAKDWGENHKHGFYVHELIDAKEEDCDGSIRDIGPVFRSCFIETPTRKLSRFKFDQTEGEEITVPFEDIAGSSVRLDVTSWQDQAATIDKDAITENLKRWGALDVDIRIIRKPRETVRSEAVLKVDRLRDKLIAMAELKGEIVPESILQKADKLETMQADELINAMTGEKVEVAA